MHFNKPQLKRLATKGIRIVIFKLGYLRTFLCEHKFSKNPSTYICTLF